MPKIASDSESRSRIIAMDAARLARWPLPHETISVPTRYGNTHVVATGPQNAQPLVLLHALGVTSTMWLPNIAALSRDHRTYALDTIGDLNGSTLNRPTLYPRNGHAYSEWLVDVFNELRIDQAHVIGASMGGWITMQHAIHAPQRVKRIVLLGPMGLPSWATTLRVLAQLWSVLLIPTQSNIDRAVQWGLGAHPSVREAFSSYISVGAASWRSRKVAPPLNLSDGQLAALTRPILLILGGRDNVIGNAREVADRATRLIPQVQVEIIPAAGHMMSTEEPQLVNARILEFLRA